MSLISPNLDDRTFQQLVDEAKKRIPHYCAEWTDHNVSDPGVTLIELFAWMMETLLYRMNQVPQLHYIKFMELFGVNRKGPEAATAPITFWLSAPQPADFTIQAGTQVSTIQTETKPPVVFATQEDFVISKPQLTAILRGETDGRGNTRYEELGVLLSEAGALPPEPVFSATPKPGDALYLGFENNLSLHILRLGFTVYRLAGGGLDPDLAERLLTWEVASGETGWAACKLDGVSTFDGFNRSGVVQLVLPAMSSREIEGKKRFWLRVCVTDVQDDANLVGRYSSSPELFKVAETSAMGRTVYAHHAQVIENEILGVSDGTAGQRFYVQSTPVLPRRPEEKRVRVELSGDPNEFWFEVDDFAGKTKSDACYTLDSITGEVRFGPAIRLRDGSFQQYGKTPPRGATLVMERYQSGGGVIGRVKSGELNTLKKSIPFVSRVVNLADAQGGQEAQTLEEIMLEMPKLLRTRQRAVTADDFEFLVESELGELVGRAHCIPPILPAAGSNELVPPTIELRIIPRPISAGRWRAEDLTPGQPLLDQVKTFLDQRRLLGTRLNVTPAVLQWVVVEVAVLAMPGANQRVLSDAILRRLYHFLNPLTGGFAGKGWPFGKTLHKWQIHQFLRQEVVDINGERDQAILQMAATLEILLFRADSSGSKAGDATDMIVVDPAGVIASGTHSVEFIQP